MNFSPDFPFFADLTEHTDALLADAPCGPDLEYHPSFLDLVASARSKPEQQLGDSVIGAREPDWRAVFDQALSLARGSRDLRIAAILVQAATELHGLTGFASGLALIRAWLEQHWNDLHPRLSLDGDYDPLMRMNALSALADPNGTLKALRHTLFLEGRFGKLSLGEAEAILKGRQAPEGSIVSSSAQLERLLADEHVRNASRLAALAQAEGTLAAIESLWRERLTPDYWPELAMLRELLTRLNAFSVQHNHGVAASPGTSSADTSSPDTSPAALTSGPDLAQSPTAPSGLSGEVSNRREAFQALASARRYFERHEPSHPAPLLIKRIERLEGLDFMDILAELSPDAIAQIRHITGTTDAVS